MSKSMTALVIDWGIGGFSVVRQMTKLKLPIDIVYFSDSGFTPYGKLSKNEVRARISKIVEEASKEHPIDMVVIACNAASTAFIGKKNIMKRPLLNMIEPAAGQIKKLKKAAVTVVGGDLTAKSKSYSRLLKKTPHKVEEVSLQPLSALIELGFTQGAKVEKVLKSRLKKLSKKSDSKLPSYLVLACTHYPAAQKTFEKLYAQTEVLDPAIAVAKKLKKKTLKKMRRKAGGKLLKVFTTGTVKTMPKVLEKSFGIKLNKKLLKKFSL
jgi:glutamate racemase